jgi:hypothetical protein
MENLPHPSPFAAVPALAIPDSGLSLMLCIVAAHIMRCCQSSTAQSTEHKSYSTSICQISLVRVTRSPTGIARYMPWIAETSPLTSHTVFPLLFLFALVLAVHQVSTPPSKYAAAACKSISCATIRPPCCQTLPPALVPPFTFVNLLTTAQEASNSKPVAP